MEALRAGTSIEKIVFLLGVQGTVVEEIRRAAERSNVPVSQASRQEFRELASDATTQGVVAIVHEMKTFVGLDEIVGAAEAKKEKPLILILDSIEDPQNLGALVRTAECAGVHGVRAELPRDRDDRGRPGHAGKRLPLGAAGLTPPGRLRNRCSAVRDGGVLNL